MAGYEYHALDTAGRTVKGVIEGDAERQVRASLRDKGLVPLRVEAIAAQAERSADARVVRKHVAGARSLRCDDQPGHVRVRNGNRNRALECRLHVCILRGTAQRFSEQLRMTSGHTMLFGRDLLVERQLPCTPAGCAQHASAVTRVFRRRREWVASLLTFVVLPPCLPSAFAPPVP